MKSVIKGIITQAIIHHRNYKILYTKDFYGSYLTKHKRYPIGYFNLKLKRKYYYVSEKLFLKIIKTYFRIYFLEFYSSKYPIYFPFGGMLQKTRSNNYYARIRNPITKQKELKKISNAIRWVWYLRPSKWYFFRIEIKKLTGTTNIIPKIERVYSQENDKELLPIFTNEIHKLKEKKNLFRCIQS